MRSLSTARSAVDSFSNIASHISVATLLNTCKGPSSASSAPARACTAAGALEVPPHIGGRHFTPRSSSLRMTLFSAQERGVFAVPPSAAMISPVSLALGDSGTPLAQQGKCSNLFMRSTTVSAVRGSHS